MTDLKFNSNLQLVWNPGGDYETIDGREELEQMIRLKGNDRLYNILSRYKQDSIPNKIEKEIRLMAREVGFIDSVADIEIEQVEQGYKVEVKLIEVENIKILLDTL